MDNSKITVARIKKYLKTMSTAERDIPTLAGLAVYLGIPKQELLEFEGSEDERVRLAFLRAKSVIEHAILSKSAYKEISSTMARFYLTSPDFAGEGRQQDDYSDISLFVQDD